MTTKEKQVKTKVINGDVYCSKCGRFLGATCDPFGEGYCKDCFPDLLIKKQVI